MSNQLTPMQELIEHISRKGVKNYPLDTLELIKELLPKEQQVIEEFKNQKEMYRECFETFIPIDKWDEATLFLSTYGNGLAKELSKKEK